ncbi:MAG: hypothetical protein EXR71_02595 [Myxococcales bacterium]|nr:hypothetical protein [Myxococcales bacterium]
MSLLLLLGCAPHLAAAPVPSAVGSVLLVGGTVVGVGVADVRIGDGQIVEVGASLERTGADVVDVSGRYLVPSFIDSHVHLAYLPAESEMADGGIAAAVDLAAPIEFLAAPHGSFRVVAAGPMVTAVAGYPTRSWGSGGYGLECADTAAAVAAVNTLHAAGAEVIKLPVTGGAQLDDASLAAAAARAHQLGLPVVSHALSDSEAGRAAAAGVDVLAHTPVGTLSSGTAAAWRGRAVITTLGAFGGSSATLGNLAALRDAGATVLYGTDFGNTHDAGIDGRELALMAAGGLSPGEILAAGTSAPAVFWGLDDLGFVAVGKAGSLLVLSEDPLADPTALAEPEQVWLAGVRRK